MRLAKIIFLCLFSLILTLFFTGFWLIERQGLRPEFWNSYKEAHVTVDDHGIPTIVGSSWDKVIEAQGYVVASDRMWQMDLIRRKAGGRLSEWFGEKAFDHDKHNQLEDRIGVAEQHLALLNREDKSFCEAYSRGVNRFINDQENRWGIEYVLLGVRPEPWTCTDSLLVVMEMVDTLTSKAKKDVSQALWQSHLPKSWVAFLFTTSHPWNKPLFGEPTPPPRLPLLEDFVPRAALPHDVEVESSIDEGNGAGSNNWAWRGKTGCFLANDPHLGYGVPGIWSLMRLKVETPKNRDADWALGAAIPGLPGITIGMTPYFSWSFTNTGEDIDDYLLETLSADQSQYLAKKEKGEEVWLPVIRKSFQVKVKGEEKPRSVEGMFTRRGPMAMRENLGTGYYSRQWLALRPGLVQLPAMAMMRSHDWESFNTAADRMTLPSQNVLFMDRKCNMGYRVTGTGIKRPVANSVTLLNAQQGEWLGLEDSKERRRLFNAVPEGDIDTAFLVTANNRIWTDDHNNNWYADDRAERISRFLQSRDDFTAEDMTALQLDTQGRFRKELMSWLATNTDTVNASLDLRKLTDGLKAWDGDSKTDPVYFALSTLAEDEMTKTLLDRVTANFIPKELREIPYTGTMKHSWLLTLMNSPGGTRAFGLEDVEFATYIMKKLLRAQKNIKPHQESNRWIVQHPFANGLPVIGWLFKIKNFDQWGAADLVDAERPTFGPSVRLIMDMKNPEKSTWILPVGQSGHIGSPYYSDQQDFWHQGKKLQIFKEEEWGQWEKPN